MKAFTQLFLANLREFARDRMALFWTIAFPVIFILIFGLIFARDNGFSADLGLVVLPLPLELPSAPIYLSWHQRYDTDHAHAWLRGLARTALAMGGASS